MSNISNNPSNNAAIQAIEDAIRIAAQKVCRDPKVDLENFDPWAKGDPLTQSSHDFCGQLFDGEIAKMNLRILKNQDMPDVISYSGTRGWLYGYSCAQDEANPVISNQANDITMLNQELSDTQNNLTQKTEEARKLKNKLEKLESSNPVKRANRWRIGLIVVAVAAIILILSDWPM